MRKEELLHHLPLIETVVVVTVDHGCSTLGDNQGSCWYLLWGIKLFMLEKIHLEMKKAVLDDPLLKKVMGSAYAM